jgi:hypothetical protein
MTANPLAAFRKSRYISSAMRIPTVLTRLFVLAACCVAHPASAQEHPARRVANIVSVAVEEYGKAIDAQGRLISAQEYSETNDFLVDAKRAADRLSGVSAAPARALLDTIAAAVVAKRPPAALDSLEARFAIWPRGRGSTRERARAVTASPDSAMARRASP